MIETIRRGWGQVPAPIRNLVRKTGVLYAANYFATYREMQRRERCAGKLGRLQQKRPENENTDKQPILDASLEDILSGRARPKPT